jgi:hypothetical protein
MKIFKNLTTGFVALTSAVLTLTASSAQAQDFDRADMSSAMSAPQTDSDVHEMRSVYLGSTGLVNKGRSVARVIQVQGHQQFRGLIFVAQDDDFQIDRAIVYFNNGGRSSFGGVRLREGQRVRADFRNYRRIDRVVIIGTSSNTFGSKAQLLVYGRL